MFISSKFHDYYDQVQALGHDASLTFHRYQEVMLVPAESDNHALKSLIQQVERLKPKFWAADFREVVVGFCGKLYLAAQHWPGAAETSAQPAKARFFYDIKAFRKAFPNFDAPQDISFYDAWGQDPEYSTFGFYAANDAVFIELGVPVFVLDTAATPTNPAGGYALIKNPNLAEYEFFRVLGPYEAYQELEMYLGNTLVNASPPPRPLADITKIITHGFDPKMGFRKRKKE